MPVVVCHFFLLCNRSSRTVKLLAAEGKHRQSTNITDWKTCIYINIIYFKSCILCENSNPRGTERKLAYRFRLINANKDVDRLCEHHCGAKKKKDKKVNFNLLCAIANLPHRYVSTHDNNLRCFHPSSKHKEIQKPCSFFFLNSVTSILLESTTVIKLFRLTEYNNIV